MSDVVAEIFSERLRQITVESHSLEDDDALPHGQLSMAASEYTLAAAEQIEASHFGRAAPDLTAPGQGWPGADDRWKPKDARRNLIRAAALIVAEVERMDRASGAGGDGTEGGPIKGVHYSRICGMKPIQVATLAHAFMSLTGTDPATLDPHGIRKAFAQMTTRGAP
jgi:hypothetical protein